MGLTQLKKGQGFEMASVRLTVNAPECFGRLFSMQAVECVGCRSCNSPACDLHLSCEQKTETAFAVEFPQVTEDSIWESRDTKLEVKVKKVDLAVDWEGGGMLGSCSAFYWHQRFKFVRY